ncbi:MAG: tail fiber domain-containing protein [Leptolyngbyaceae cyanobacterium SL_7_1]|nr:tail fiber domain-containing protein [Leptolyngbyaceae cyanobacterium SL_7_1]
MPNITDDTAKNVKLYTEGNVYVNGNLFAQEAKAASVTGGTIEQLSSRTIKENIRDLSSQEAAEMLKQLNPVKFNYTLPTDQTLHTGFIAEEIPELLTSPDRQAVRLLDVVAVLTKTIKDQREGMLLLNRVVKQQQAAIAALTEKVAQLENR